MKKPSTCIIISGIQCNNFNIRESTKVKLKLPIVIGNVILYADEPGNGQVSTIICDLAGYGHKINNYLFFIYYQQTLRKLSAK